jgi:hypothetical protein
VSLPSVTSPPPSEKRARLKEWLATGAASLQPLTLTQRELWEAAPVRPEDPANHICALIDVRGLLTPRECLASLQLVVDRQEALRISFLPGKDRPLQLIRAKAEANLEFRELSSSQCSPEGIEEVARELFLQPFDLVGGPVYRAAALRRSADSHVLVLAIHHAVADGWTLGVFVRDLFGAYLQTLAGSHEPLPSLPISYTGWGEMERKHWDPARLATMIPFWRNHLQGRPRLWSTPQHPAPASGPARRWVSSIDAKLATAAQDLGRRSGATLYSTLLTAFQIALSKWTGSHDIVVGSPSANRTKQIAHETMGYFAGIVPIRGPVDPERPFVEALKAVQETTVDAFGHAMPFVELAAALGDQAGPGYNPIFEVRFALQNHPIPDVSFPSMSVKLRMRSTGTARLDLGCEVTEQDDGFEVVWLYRHARFTQKDVEELDALFKLVLSNACAAPGRRTRELI